MDNSLKQLIDVLLRGGIAVIRTDTLYGIVARAEDEQAVERVYRVKGRDTRKSCILLVSDASQVYGDQEAFRHDTTIPVGQPASYLIESPSAPHWLLRENQSLAYRLPGLDWLRLVISHTGPLIAPSANPEGLPPARTIEQARQYFGQWVDLYVDGGEVSADTPPSRLVKVKADGSLVRIR